jgi:hypothetical protein
VLGGILTPRPWMPAAALDAAPAEFLRCIEERAGPEWGNSTRVALGTETACMTAIVPLAELLGGRE